MPVRQPRPTRQSLRLPSDYGEALPTTAPLQRQPPARPVSSTRRGKRSDCSFLLLQDLQKDSAFLGGEFFLSQDLHQQLFARAVKYALRQLADEASRYFWKLPSGSILKRALIVDLR